MKKKANHKANPKTKDETNSWADTVDNSFQRKAPKQSNSLPTHCYMLSKIHA